MALEQKLSLKLAQKLVMTPSLQQAIKLLQMTRLELEGVLAQEMEENPVLEENDVNNDESSDVVEPGSEGEAAEKAALETTEVAEETKSENTLEDIDLDAYFGEYSERFEGPGFSLGEDRQAPPLENTLTEAPDLYDHLLWQLRMTQTTTLIREIAEQIIGNLNATGFLAASIEELQAMGVDGSESTIYREEDVAEALELVQNFDPPGVASASLQECLLKQLDLQEEPEDSLARRMISETWDLVTRRKFELIAKKLGVPLKKLQGAVETIRGLEPRPGRQFNTESPQYVEPDVYVVKVGEEYLIQLNDDGLPRLRVSKAYRQMLKNMHSDNEQGDAQAFIKDKMRSALWLIKSLNQRQNTIYKVTKSIVDQQRGFLDRGIDHLRPMVLRDVADDIEMHESTVSRVTTNKYAHTPQGIFELKYFFNSSINRVEGDAIASESVKEKIRKIVSNEDPRRPLSDQRIAEMLKTANIDIARRTVTKYREAMNILSSTRRRQVG